MERRMLLADGLSHAYIYSDEKSQNEQQKHQCFRKNEPELYRVGIGMDYEKVRRERERGGDVYVV
jgi:pyrroloquinoline quinone (PQQ) biosynthesis protein C